MVEQTRPITILSMIYRIWSRVVAAKFISHVRPFLPDSIQGNRPGSSSKWVAAYIQTQIEIALHQGTEYNVSSLDLTKAYNLLSRPLLSKLSGVFGVPVQITKAYLGFLDSLRVHADLSPPVYSTVGVPEGCAFAVYAMLQLNWLLVVDVRNHQTEQHSVSFLNYVDNWLFTSYRNQVLHDVLSRVHDTAKLCNYRISATKTWSSSTSAAARKSMRGWSFLGQHPLVCEHKLELGMLMKFTRRMTVKEVAQRWDEGVQRMNRLILQSWSPQRKLFVIRRGIFPQIFASCETSHISLSCFRRLRGKLNVVMHGSKTHSSHYLSPLLTSQQNYEPFLYVFSARLSALKATLLSFGSDVSAVWMLYKDLDLNFAPTKILGPVGCFLWTCQIVGWKVSAPLEVTTGEGVQLHLHHTPLKNWKLHMDQAWVDWAILKSRMDPEMKPEVIPWATFQTLWSQ